MKVSLDECVPWPLHSLLMGHACETPVRRGWGGIKNGALLQAAEGEFDLFITCDQNIRYQQNLAGRKIAIIELSTNNWRDIRAAIDLIRTAADAIGPGEYRTVVIP